VADLATDVLNVLGRGPRKARFVSEVASGTHAAPDDLNQVLAQLESAGKVLVREEYCGDPHLEGIDLRIVALIQPGEGDPLSTAVENIDKTWQRWLAEYLANHRCT
jgi:hypothetical protein